MWIVTDENSVELAILRMQMIYHLHLKGEGIHGDEQLEGESLNVELEQRERDAIRGGLVNETITEESEQFSPRAP